MSLFFLPFHLTRQKYQDTDCIVVQMTMAWSSRQPAKSLHYNIISIKQPLPCNFVPVNFTNIVVYVGWNIVNVCLKMVPFRLYIRPKKKIPWLSCKWLQLKWLFSLCICIILQVWSTFRKPQGIQLHWALDKRHWLANNEYAASTEIRILIAELLYF